MTNNITNIASRRQGIPATPRLQLNGITVEGTAPDYDRWDPTELYGSSHALQHDAASAAMARPTALNASRAATALDLSIRAAYVGTYERVIADLKHREQNNPERMHAWAHNEALMAAGEVAEALGFDRVEVITLDLD